MAQPPRKPPTDKIASLAEILPVLCQDLALDQKVNEMALLALWPAQLEALAGKTLAEQSKAVRLKKQGHKTILWVRVANAALASELGFLTEDLKTALNHFSPQTGITIDRIQLTVGAV